MAEGLSPTSVLLQLRSAYPGGIVPGGDYPALLAVLNQHLPVDDVVRVATELVVRGVNPLTGTDLRGALAAVLPHQVVHTEVDRVTQHLRTAGWTFSDTA